MNLKDIAEKLELKVISGSVDKEVNGGYSSDLLSDVIAYSQKDNIWITLQTHVNTIAVANLKELAGIVIVNGRQPEEAALTKAVEEDITVMLTDLQTFEIVGRLYEMGIRGN